MSSKSLVKIPKLLSFLLVWTAFGCVNQQLDNDDSELAISHPLPPEPIANEIALVAPEVPKPKVHCPDDPKQYDLFLQRIANPEHIFGELDEQILALSLEIEKKGLVAEGAVALSLLRGFLREKAVIHSRAESEESLEKAADEKSEEESDKAPAELQLTLEEKSKEHYIDFLQVFSYNPYVQSYAAHQLLLNSIAVSADRPEYKDKVFAVIKHHAARWGLISEYFDELEKPDEESKTPDKIRDPLPFDGADMQSGDQILGQATELLEAQQFKQAISLLKTIPKSNVHFATASEKVKEASNLAVDELRKKAAKIYRAARPLIEQKERVRYLERAQQHLEAALDEYPDSDQLDTVKQNLVMIEKYLDVVKKNG